MNNVTIAVERLDKVLPLRMRQMELPGPVRVAHQNLLRCFLQTGQPPARDDDDWAAGADAKLVTKALLDSGLIVTHGGRIGGAYPFTTEAREHRVLTRFGEVRAMCSIDALGIGAMFDLATTIHSKCRVSGRPIQLEQHASERVEAQTDGGPVLAAIDWNAGRDAGTCAATLCLEMSFITVDAEEWRQDDGNRQTLTLDEALAFAAAVFRPLMQ